MPEVTARAVRALLVPLQGGRMLLLPNAAVAEVVTLRDLAPAPPEAPAWQLGTLPWRGLALPVVAYEALDGEAAGTPGAGTQVLVLNRLEAGAGLGYYGLVAAGIPHLMVVGEGQLEATATPGAGSYALCDLRLGESRAAIPDLAAIEARLVD